MQINVSARHGQLAEESQQKIAQKLKKLSRFSDRITAVDAMIDLAHSANPEVEIVARVEKSPDFVSRLTATNGNLLGAVEAALHKLQEQLKKHKQKRIDSNRVPAARDNPMLMDEDIANE